MLIADPRRAKWGPTPPRPVRAVLARLTAGALAALGGLLVAQAATGGPASALAGVLRDLRFYLPSAAPGTVVLAGAAFLLVGRGLWLRRANARWLALALLAADALFAVHSDRRTLPGMGAAVVAGLVVATGGEYNVPRARDVTPAFAKLLGLTAAVDVVVGTVLVALVRAVPRPFAHPMTVGWVVMDGLSGRHAGLYGVAPGERWLLPMLTAAGGLTLFVLLGALLALPTAPLDGTRPRRSLARVLSDHRDGDTLDPFVLRTDKLHYLSAPTSASLLASPSGTSDGGPRTAVGYRPIFGVALASGHPLGARAAAGEALSGYLDHCRRHGWRPCIIGLDEHAAAICRSLGMHTICIGDEAVLDVEGFRLDVPAMRNVRQAVKRSHNFGVTTAIIREGDLSEELRGDLLSVSAAGRGTVPERGFSMGLGEPFDGSFPDCVVAVAFSADGRAIGFQRYAPCKAGAALSLDVMRRVPGSPNGVNERLISDVVAWADENGVEEVSLNFAAFRALMDLGPDRNRLQRIEYWLVHRLDRWVKVESLYRFNAKFRPRWLPRFVAFGSYTDLGWVGLAALTAEFSLRVDRFSVRSTPDWLPALGHRSFTVGNAPRSARAAPELGEP